MALIKCPECGKMFSEHAKCCPNCACPISFALKAAKHQTPVNKMPKIMFYELATKTEKAILLEFKELIKKLLPDYELSQTAATYGFYNKSVTASGNNGNIYCPKICWISRDAKTQKLNLHYKKIDYSNEKMLPLSSKTKIDLAWKELTKAYSANKKNEEKVHNNTRHTRCFNPRIAFDSVFTTQTVKKKFHTICLFLLDNGFSFEESTNKISFFYNLDKEDGYTEPLLSFYVKNHEEDFAGVHYSYPCLFINYSLYPNSNKIERYIYLGSNFLSENIITQIKEILYHRKLLKKLLPHSVYLKIIKTYIGYEEIDSSNDFNVIGNLISARGDEIENETKSTIFDLNEAIEMYKFKKYNAIYNKVSSICDSSCIEDKDLLMKSVRECVYEDDYYLCKIKGVTSGFMTFLDSENYWNLIGIIRKFDAQSIYDELFKIKWDS